MTGDIGFSKILSELRKIHRDFPDLRFGQVIQNALDQSKRQDNVNLNETSSKTIYKCLVGYYEWTKKARVKSDGSN